jgi:hypothetical protein
LPFGANGRDGGGVEFVGGQGRCAGQKQEESCQPTRNEPGNSRNQ